MEPKDLYSTKDVQEERRRLYDNQKGIDPILEQHIAFNDSVCDHDHTTQHTRAALHRQTNAFEGKVINAHKRHLSWMTDVPLSVILRNLADYLEKDYSENPHHPKWKSRVQTDFNACNEGQKKELLHTLGSIQGDNGAQRKKLFTGLVNSKNFSFSFIQNLLKGIKHVSR